MKKPTISLPLFLVTVLCLATGWNSWKNSNRVDELLRQLARAEKQTPSQQSPYNGDIQSSSLNPITKESSPQDPMALSKLFNEQAELRSNLRQVNLQLARLRQSLTEGTAGSKLMTNSQAATSKTLSASPASEAATRVERNNMLTQTLETDFYREDIDESWSTIARDHLNTMIESYNSEKWSGVNFGQIECRTTFCRISFNADNQMAYEKFNKNLPAILQWDTSYFMNELNDGSFVLFVAKDGSQLPVSVIN